MIQQVMLMLDTLAFLFPKESKEFLENFLQEGKRITKSNSGDRPHGKQ